jgi:transposase InsO family protein
MSIGTTGRLLNFFWEDWQSGKVAFSVFLVFQTVVGWHQQGFRLYWRWKSRSGKIGRPNLELTVQELIRRMARENPLWGAPRIQAELRLLGHDTAESTVARYMTRRRKPPSPTWRSFLANHAREIAAIDFFVVATARFRLLYCFLVLSHDRRCVLHFGVTAHPTSVWTARQLVEAFPFAAAPRFLLHDRDSIYGNSFQKRANSLGIEELATAPRSPWQNPYVERLIGSIRRECLDHVIVLNEAHLQTHSFFVLRLLPRVANSHGA